MMDRNFDDTIPRAFDERRDKPVHPFERDDRGDAFLSQRLQRAPGVTHIIFDETASNEVRDPARRALDPGVLALFAITAHQIGATIDFSEQTRDVGWIVLQIAVD